MLLARSTEQTRNRRRLRGSLGFSQAVLLSSPEYFRKDPRTSELKSERTLPVRLWWGKGERNPTSHVV